MKKSLLFLSILLVFGMFSFVFAENNNSNVNKSDEVPVPTLYANNASNNSVNGSQVSNMTYGSCVSQYAQLKNTCFTSVKQGKSACVESAKNSTNKSAIKQCSQDFGLTKKECKAEFKIAKKEVCAQIKHNFLETIGSAFK